MVWTHVKQTLAYVSRLVKRLNQALTHVRRVTEKRSLFILYKRISRKNITNTFISVRNA